ncbi:MAG: DUF3352 domain-containing protein [Pirellulaceae bacterium]
MLSRKNILTLTLPLLFLAPAVARPPAFAILPEKTVAYVSVEDSNRFRERLGRTGMGAMLQDEEIRPLVQDLYGSATELVRELEDRAGMTLEQILAVPNGEVTLAVVAPPALKPVIVALVDIAEAEDDAKNLLELGADELNKQGFNTRKETVEGVELQVYQRGTNDDEQVVRFQFEQTIVLCSSFNVAKKMVPALQGNDEGTLIDNQAFAAIMDRCDTSRTSSPELTWFVDPIGLFRAANRGNVGAQVALAMLPSLGLDGLSGIGGSLVLPQEEAYESISHLHVLLENPRDGILEMIALDTGSCVPETWVPAEVGNYSTWHLDVKLLYSVLKDLVDSFREEGYFGGLVKSNISERIGIDFEQDFIAQLDGRATYLNWFEPPAGIGSQGTLIGLKVRDVGVFQESLETVTEKFEDFIEPTQYGGQKIYRIQGPGENLEDRNDEDLSPRERRQRRQMQRIRPAFALVDDYLLVTDRISLLELALDVRSNAAPSLKDSDDYQYVSAELAKQPNGSSPSMFGINRPVEAFQMLYEWVQAPESREFMHQRRDRNQFFRAVDDALERNPLPPFTKLEKYLMPAGSMITNEESGIHVFGFNARYDDSDGQ